MYCTSVKARSSTCAWSHLFEGLRLQGECLFCTPDPSIQTFTLSTSQALPFPQRNNKQCWLSSFWAQIINPSGVNLSRALNGGKGGCTSVFLSTKLMLVADFSAQAHLVHLCWAQHIQCGNSKEAQPEKWVIFGCLFCAAMRCRANTL